MGGHALGTHFEHDLGDVGAFGLEGQKLQVGASLENPHNDVICTSCKHAVVAERAGDSGWRLGLECVLASLSGIFPLLSSYILLISV